MEPLQIKRWLRALNLAKILFEGEAYHTHYLDEIENYLREHEGHGEQLGFNFAQPCYKIGPSEKFPDFPGNITFNQGEVREEQIEFDFELKKGE